MIFRQMSGMLFIPQDCVNGLIHLAGKGISYCSSCCLTLGISGMSESYHTGTVLVAPFLAVYIIISHPS